MQSNMKIAVLYNSSNSVFHCVFNLYNNTEIYLSKDSDYKTFDTLEEARLFINDNLIIENENNNELD